jgi:hypothetical protein
MLCSILDVLGRDSCVLWGGSDAFYFVEKCSVSLVAGRETGLSGEYLSTIFAPYMPPYGAAKASVSLPSLDPRHGGDSTSTATHLKQVWSESGPSLELD